MSFWDLVSEVKSSKSDSVEISASFDPIPDGTTALAQVVSAKWKKAFEREEEFLEIQWEVLEPASLNGRKFFAKHWIKDEDSSVKDDKKRSDKLKKHFTLFGMIDRNTGERIVNYLSSKREWPSEDNINVALANKPMLIEIKEWEMNGNRGNWVNGVFSKGKKDPAEGKGSAPKSGSSGASYFEAQDDWGSPAPQSQPAASGGFDDGDLIPF